MSQGQSPKQTVAAAVVFSFDTRGESAWLYVPDVGNLDGAQDSNGYHARRLDRMGDQSGPRVHWPLGSQAPLNSPGATLNQFAWISGIAKTDEQRPFKGFLCITVRWYGGWP
jgi:hypothetical protein